MGLNSHGFCSSAIHRFLSANTLSKFLHNFIIMDIKKQSMPARLSSLDAFTVSISTNANGLWLWIRLSLSVSKHSTLLVHSYFSMKQCGVPELKVSKELYSSMEKTVNEK